MSTIERKILIEQRVTNEGKSAVVAYLFWFFLPFLGAHRMYLGRVGSGVAMLLLSISVVGLVISIPWMIVDLFRIGNMVREENDKLRATLLRDSDWTSS